jgi:hypothetical protein
VRTAPDVNLFFSLSHSLCLCLSRSVCQFPWNQTLENYHSQIWTDDFYSDSYTLLLAALTLREVDLMNDFFVQTTPANPFFNQLSFFTRHNVRFTLLVFVSNCFPLHLYSYSRGLHAYTLSH